MSRNAAAVDVGVIPTSDAQDRLFASVRRETAPSVLVMADISGKYFWWRCGRCTRQGVTRLAKARAQHEAAQHNGECTGTPAPAVLRGREVLVASRSRKGIAYHVVFGAGDGACCSCAAWEFHATCPHIEIAKQRRSAA